MRVLRKRSRTKTTNRPTPALSFTLKAHAAIGSGTHARYPLLVAADGSINREAWAELIGHLRQERAKGKTATFARLIRVDPRTVDRWLRCEVNVKEESVRALARALEINAVDLLVQVGYYEPAELSPPTYPDPRKDKVIQMILADPRLTEDRRAELVQLQIELIEADVQRRMAEYNRLVGFQQERRAAP